jgi:hypothetical protein
MRCERVGQRAQQGAVVVQQLHDGCVEADRDSSSGQVEADRMLAAGQTDAAAGFESRPLHSHLVSWASWSATMQYPNCVSGVVVGER